MPDNLEAFRYDLSNRFGIGRVEADATSFSSRLAAWQLPASSSLMEVTVSAPVSIERRAAHVERAEEGFFTVGMLLQGSATLRQGGRTARLRQLDLVLCDSRRPFDMTFDGAFRQLLFNVPSRQLDSYLAMPEKVTARAVSGRVGFASVAASMMLAARAQAGSLAGYEALLEQHLIEVLASVFGRRDDDLVDPAAIALRKVEHFIATNLQDPALSPDMIASRHGFSRRYLYKLFAASGEGVAESIRKQRLELARAMLAEGGHARRTISEVAYAAGFSSPNQLTRVFQRAFGERPRDYRRRSMQPAQTGATPSERGNECLERP